MGIAKWDKEPLMPTMHHSWQIFSDGSNCQGLSQGSDLSVLARVQMVVVTQASLHRVKYWLLALPSGLNWTFLRFVLFEGHNFVLVPISQRILLRCSCLFRIALDCPSPKNTNICRYNTATQVVKGCQVFL